MPEVDIFEFMHEIHVCGLQRYSMNKNLKLKKKSVPITEHETNGLMRCTEKSLALY